MLQASPHPSLEVTLTRCGRVAAAAANAQVLAHTVPAQAHAQSPCSNAKPYQKPYQYPPMRQEAPLAAELVLATLLETARPGDAGPATVARDAAGRLDTPGGGHIPGDTPWARPEAGEASRAPQGLCLSQEECDG